MAHSSTMISPPFLVQTDKNNGNQNPYTLLHQVPYESSKEEALMLIDQENKSVAIVSHELQSLFLFVDFSDFSHFSVILGISRQRFQLHFWLFLSLFLYRNLLQSIFFLHSSPSSNSAFSQFSFGLESSGQKWKYSSHACSSVG